MTDHFDHADHIRNADRADAHGCASFGDGHRVHHIRARKAFHDSDLSVGALVRVLDETHVELSWDGVRLVFRHHDTAAIVRAVDVGGEIATWVPQWRVLILPGPDPHVPATFTLAAPDHWEECVPGHVPVLTYVPGL